MYDATSQGFYRAPDADNTPGNEVVGGMAVLVLEGTTHAGSAWTLTAPTGTAVLGTDSLTFAQFSSSGGGGVVEGTGIDITSGVVSVDWSNAPLTTAVANTDLLMLQTASGQEAITRDNFLRGASVTFDNQVSFNQNLFIATTNKQIQHVDGWNLGGFGAGVFGIGVTGNASVVTWDFQRMYLNAHLRISEDNTEPQIFFTAANVVLDVATNGDVKLGAFGAEQLRIDKTNRIVSIENVDALRIPAGGTANRPTGGGLVVGVTRNNTDTNRIEWWNGSEWLEYIPANSWSYAETTYGGTNPIPGFFAFAPFSQNTVHVYVNRDPLRNSEFAIVNGTDLQIVGYPINNGDTVWAKYA